MNRLVFILLIGFFFFFKNSEAQNACNCCQWQYELFHFWVGEWKVEDTTGNVVGYSSITLSENNCIMNEKWKSTSGYTGSSINFFDAQDSTWNQVWVDQNGSVLNLKGNFIDGKMILKSEITQDQEGNSFYNQISWSQDPKGNVTQQWDTFDPNGKLIKTLFIGYYKPRTKK